MQERCTFGSFLIISFCLISLEVKERSHGCSQTDSFEMRQMESSTGWNKDSQRETARDLAYHSCAIHFNFIFLEWDINVSFSLQWKSQSLTEKTTGIFKLVLINTAQYSLHVQCLVCIFFTLVFSPAVWMCMHISVLWVSLTSLFLFERRKKWQLSTQGVVIKKDNI